MKKKTVILVHGFGDTSQKMAKLAKFLNQKNTPTFSIDLSPSDGSKTLEELAQQLQMYIEDNIKDNNEKIDLIGYSMGGLVCRYYLQKLGGINKTNHFISIASPNNGTYTAYFNRNIGIKQMRPKSDFLNSLNADSEKLRQIKFTIIWSPLDLMIVPATSSKMNEGNIIKTFIPTHPLMMQLNYCFKIIDSILQQ